MNQELLERFIKVIKIPDIACFKGDKETSPRRSPTMY